MCGYNETRRCMGVLYDNYIKATEASAKDDQLDEDGERPTFCTALSTPAVSVLAGWLRVAMVRAS
jgi:hypothetical protein|eukprot:COSAG01_NODE_812_length_13409_cov_20.449812_15_plen_65_part_00